MRLHDPVTNIVLDEEIKFSLGCVLETKVAAVEVAIEATRVAGLVVDRVGLEAIWVGHDWRCACDASR